MTWTTPRTFAAGEILTSANMNTHVRDNLKFLYNGTTGNPQPQFLAKDVSSQTFPQDVRENINFATIVEDNNSAYDASNNFYAAPIAGVYLLVFSVQGDHADANLYRVYAGYGVTASTNEVLLGKFIPALVTTAEQAVFSFALAVRLAAADHLAPRAAISATVAVGIGAACSISWLHP